MAELVLVDRPAERIARIALNRPERRNALNNELRLEFIAAVEGALSDDEVRALIITGAGGHFCGGGDLTSMPQTTRDMRARLKTGHRGVRLLLNSEKPVVAAVEGHAAGAGASIALLADLIVMGRSGHISIPFFKVGLVPDWGMLHTLPRRIGAARARQAILLARSYASDEALEIGLADRVVDDEEVQAAALEQAQTLAALPPHAFAILKQQLTAAPTSLDTSLEMEALAQSICVTGEEFAEGAAAFKAKRKPVF
ncbi:MAG: enoyl-CoA hydratase-related protein [Pseudomonadota bacterium]